MQEGTYAFNESDKPNTTIKQTTIGNTRVGQINKHDGSYVLNPNDKPETTIKKQQ